MTREYKLASKEGWINGERYLTVTKAVACASGPIFYLWEDDQLVLVKDIRGFIIKMLEAHCDIHTVSIPTGHFELKDLPDEYLISLIGMSAEASIVKHLRKHIRKHLEKK